MKTRALLGMALIAALATGCSNEDELFSVSGHSTITVTVEDEAETRVNFSKQKKFYWTKGDQVGVGTTYAFSPYTLVGDGGTVSGTFTGAAGSPTKGFVIYPHSNNHKISADKTTLTYYFPETYNYGSNVDTDFFESDGSKKTDGHSWNAPFFGQLESGNVMLRHLGAVFAIKITDMPIQTGSIELSTLDNKKISGIYTATVADCLPTADGSVTGIIAETTSAEEEQKVTISFDNITANQDAVFYFPVPAVSEGESYGAIRIRLLDTDGTEQMNLVSDNDEQGFAMTRKKLRAIYVVKGSLSVTGEVLSKTVTSNDEVTAAWKDYESDTDPALDLTVTNAAVTTFNLPESFTKDATTNSKLNINYTVVPTTINITQHGVTGTPASGVSRGKITVTLPAGTTNATINILTPNLTVELVNASGSGITLNEISATTGHSTFILGKNITTTTLKANGGSIEVNGTATTLTVSEVYNTAPDGIEGAEAVASITIASGATVGTLEMKNDNVELKGGGAVTKIEDKREGSPTEPVTVTVVATPVIDEETGQPEVGDDGQIVEEEVIVPTVSENLPENAVIISSGESTLIAALEDETVSEYTLTKNIELTSPLIINKTFTLDLGTYSITPKETTLIPAENYSGTQSLIYVTQNGNLTLKGSGTIDTGNNEPIYAAVSLNNRNGADSNTPNGILTIDGPTLKGYYYGIMGQGQSHGTTITVNSGKLTGYANQDHYGIYHPQKGTLTINGGEINATTGIEMRSGSLTINGGTITATGNPVGGNPNTSGTTIKGAAVAISQHTTDLDLKLNIPATSTATLKGLYAIYEIDLHDEKVSNISMEVAGGTFDGQIFSENCSGFISAGEFNDPSALGYVKANSTGVKVSLTKDYTGSGMGIYNSGNGAGATVNIDLNGHTWNLTDTPLHGSGEAYKTQYFHLEKGATVNISSTGDMGTILVPSGTVKGQMLINNYCNLTLNNVKLDGKNLAGASYVLSNNSGKVEINNSILEAPEGQVAFDVYYWPSGGYNDGAQVTVKGNSVITGNVEFTTDGTSEEQKHSLTIENGTFNGAFTVGDKAYNGSNIVINGGTFSDPRALNYVADNKSVTIDMKRNVEVTAPVKLEKTGASALVKLNGYTISNKTEIEKCTELFYVGGTSELTIEGEGKVECTANDSDNNVYAMTVFAYGTGKVNLKGGHFYNSQKTNTQLDLIYAKENATINISGGKFESATWNGEDSNRKHWVLNIKDDSRETAHINVTGGDFVNFNPANNFSEGSETSFIDKDEYEVTSNGSITEEAYSTTTEVIYTVRKRTKATGN